MTPRSHSRLFPHLNAEVGVSTLRGYVHLRAPVVVLVGAGLSTASGIPDYRGDSGLWRRFDPDEFHITRFLTDPARFWDRRVDLVRHMNILEARPNAGHHSLAAAVRDGRVATLITQNVDGLHHKADTPVEHLIEVHGNGARVVCVKCGRREPTVAVLARHEPGHAPRCACGGLQKPDVVLFGEPVTELERAARAVHDAGTLVTVGTSLSVWPVAGLVQDAVRRGIDLVILNRDPTPFDAEADAVLRGDVVDELQRLFP